MAGRPLTYKTVEELQKAIDDYFISCGGHVLKEDDEIIYDKKGQPVIVGQKPPTVTGLALALGFTSRQALLNYQAKKQFVDTVTRAKSYIEEYVEGRLFDRDGVQGAKFSLINNFKGWTEKATVNVEDDRSASIIDALKGKAVTVFETEDEDDDCAD